MILVTHLSAVKIRINWTYQDIHEDFPMLSWYVPSPLKKDKEKNKKIEKKCIMLSVIVIKNILK